MMCRLMIACVALAILGGCARPGAIDEAKRTLKADALVTMSGFSFTPDHLTIKVGQTVEWNNTASLETHTVTDDPALARSSSDVAMPAGAKPFNSGDLKPGQVFRHTFTVPGTYRYFCEPHAGMGMIGVVEVQP